MPAASATTLSPKQHQNFLAALMRAHGLPHYDGGGLIGSIGGGLQGVAGDFTAQNNFTAQLAPTTQVDYTGAGSQGGQNALQGYGTAQQTLGQQQALAQQLQAQAQGQGPNPALAQLAKTTGQNVAQQAALMASQRGASANPGLVARQAAEQGANAQQQAAGQAATLRAQQQLAAQQALGQQQAAIQQANLGEQNLNAGLYGTSGQLNNTQNANNISNYANAQGINAATAQSNANATQKTNAGLLGGLSSIGGLFADGGEVAPILHYQAPQASDSPGTFDNFNGSSMASKFLGGGAGPAGDMSLSQPALGSSAGLGGAAPGLGVLPASGAGAAAPSLGIAQLAPLAALAKGGKVPALVSPGERYLPPQEVKEVAKGKKEAIKAGEKIPGKPKVSGAKNDYANDTVPKSLDEGGIILPRSVTQAKDPGKAASAFVMAILNKKGLPNKPKGA